MELIEWIIGGIGIEIGRTIASFGFTLLLLPVVAVIALIGWIIEKVKG